MYSTAVSRYCRANQGTINLAIIWALLSIGILVMSLRLYVRFGPRYKIGWDDYTAVASLVSSPIMLYRTTNGTHSSPLEHRSLA